MLCVLQNVISEKTTIAKNGTLPNWAVLVSGADTYWNYWSQANVCHAYNALIKRGMPANRIISFSYNDAVNSSSNPFPGKLFNEPTFFGPGKDIYKGCVLDYSGSDVTPQNFLNVIQGNKTSLAGVGSGRVLESSSDEYVFFFLSDHGSPGTFYFPGFEGLAGSDLIAALINMHSKKMYKQMACNSGSIMQNLPNNLSIYAITAANPTQDELLWFCGSSYGQGSNIVSNQSIGACMSDQFSYGFLHNMDVGDLSVESLQAQFNSISKFVNGSTAMQFGDVSFVNETSNLFEGNIPLSITLEEKIYSYFFNQNLKNVETLAMKDAKLNHLQWLDQKFNNETTKLWVQQEIDSRQNWDLVFYSIITLSRFPDKVDQILHPQIEQCYRQLHDLFVKQCGALDGYVVSMFNNFVYMCNTDTLDIDQKKTIVEESCQIRQEFYNQLI